MLFVQKKCVFYNLHAVLHGILQTMPVLFVGVQGCTVEVEPGLVFVGGGGGVANGHSCYLVQPESGGLLQQLPIMPHDRQDHSCGAVPARSGVGVDIVVAGGYDGGYLDSVDIYNTETGVWRPGRPPYVD